MRFFLLFALALLLDSGLKAQVVSLSHLPVNSGYPDVKGLKLNSSGSEGISNLYLASVTHQNDFINGIEYIPYFYRGKTSPFMFSGMFFHATLYFNNRKFENISLQYDTFLDELVYTDTTRILHSALPRISLNRELVQGFSFNYNWNSYNFRYLKFSPDVLDSPAEGFYEVVYEGSSMFIIRHRSLEYVRDAINEYKYYNIKYIRIGNKFRKVTNLKEFLLAFGDKSEAVKDFIQKERIRFRKASKIQISEILRFYDGLENG
jgi:hypothetical protein